MTTYRAGTHHGVTICREGDGHTCGRPGHDCARGHLVAVITNDDWALAERICALLNAETPTRAEGFSRWCVNETGERCDGLEALERRTAAHASDVDHTRGAAEALAVVLGVLDGWIEGAKANHDGLGHRGEPTGEECWTQFHPDDIRNMVADAANELGVTLPVKKHTEPSPRDREIADVRRRIAEHAEHRPSSPGGDGLGYGPCAGCGQLWPCFTSRIDRAADEREAGQ